MESMCNSSFSWKVCVSTDMYCCYFNFAFKIFSFGPRAGLVEFRFGWIQQKLGRLSPFVRSRSEGELRAKSVVFLSNEPNRFIIYCKCILFYSISCFIFLNFIILGLNKHFFLNICEKKKAL